MFQQSRNNPPRTSSGQSQSSSPLGSLIDLAEKIADEGAKAVTKHGPDLSKDAGRVMDGLSKTLGNTDVTKATKSLESIGTLIARGNVSITALDRAVQDLDNNAPGMVTNIKDLTKLFNDSLKLIPPSLENLQYINPVVTDMKSASSALKNLASKYNDYTNAPDYSFFSPSTWGVKSGKALETLNAMKDFKQKFEKFEDTVATQVSKLPQDILDNL